MKTLPKLYVSVLLFVLFLFARQGLAQNGCCNILTNGNFEAGNTGFTTGLTLNCGCTANPNGTYCVNTNFTTKCPQWPPLADHTTGSGRFLIVDGNPNGPVDVWRNTVNITTAGTYCFSFWAATIFTESFDLELRINGAPVSGAVFTLGQGPLWVQYSFNLTLPAGSQALVLRQVTGGAVRDFGLDDIVFGAPIVADFVSTPGISCGVNVQFFSQSTGPAPLTYSWNFGDPASGAANTSTLQNPTHKFTKCEDFEVCLTVTRGNCSEKICKTITVFDDEGPTAQCLGVGVVLNASCTGTVTPALIDGGSTDNCGIASSTVSPTTLTGCGLFPVTLTVTDLCGNSSTCTANVQTTETVPPSITCPPGISVQGALNAQGICTGQIKLPVIAVADNCDANVAVTNNGPGLIFPVGLTTVIYTATDDCGNTATCSWTVTVIACSKACPCPNGGQPEPNLVKNGDFSNGNMDFTNDFSYFAPGGATSFGAYSVLTQPDVPLGNGQWSGAGSTTGSSTDLFLVCDGVPLNGGNVGWRQTIPGTATGTFSFCFNANNLVITARNYADPRIQGFVNGVAVTPAVVLPEAPDQWIAITGTWTGTLPAVLEIRTLSGAVVGNDFGLDDISFSRCGAVPNPCVADFIFQASNSCGGYSFANTSTGVGATPTWEWEVDGNVVANTQNFNYQFLTPGVHQVCLSVNGRECRVCKKVTVDIAPPKINCPPDTCIFVPYQPNVGLQVMVNYDPPVVSIPTGCQVTVDCQAPSGSFFGVGTTPVTCTATLLPAGVTSSCTFLVMIKEDTLPTFSPLSPICMTDPPVLLNTYATPSGGTFTGAGVTCGGGFCTFDPATAGVGVHAVTYTYTNSYNHTFTTFANIQVTPASECDTSNCCLRNEVLVQTLSEDPCCFNISVENYCPKEFAGVCLQGLQGVQFASSMANPNWTKYEFGTSKILFDAPGSSVPANAVSLIGKVCLLNPAGSPQQIEVIFVDQNYQPTDCRRIIETYCPASKDTACLLPIKTSVVCNTDGTYTYTFSVVNMTKPAFTINYLEVNTDPNFTALPSFFNIPGGLAPNGQAGPFSMTISGSGAVAGASFCITLTGHDTNITTDPATMCCTDTARFCIKLPNCCDCKKHLKAHVIPKGNGATDCCYQLEINNQYKCHPLAFVEAKMITAGVTYGTVTPQPGWYYTGGSTVLNFYKFPPGNVPIGISQLPTFCLDNHLPVQYIALNYHFTVNGQDKILCSDTLTLVCPPEAACDSIVEPKLVCLQNGDYQYSFQVYNNSGQSINTVTLLPTTPGVLPIAPITIPTLTNGSTSATITVIIPGSQLAGQATFCVKLKVSMSLNGLEIFCCTNPNPVCVPVPPCPCECGKWNVASFTIGGKVIPGNPCGGTLTVVTGEQIVLNQSFSCIGVNCNATYLWELFQNGNKVGPAYFSNSGSLNVQFSVPGYYCYRITPYCNGKPCEPCYVCFEVRPKQECECGQWVKLNLTEPPFSSPKPVTCGSTLLMGCNQLKTLTGMYQCNSPAGACAPKYQYTVTGGSLNIQSAITSTLNVPLGFTQAGLYTVTIDVWCGGLKCPPCVIQVEVSCPPGCDCGGPKNMQFAMGGRPTVVECNKKYDFACPISPLTVTGTLTCVGNCKPGAGTWQLNGPNSGSGNFSGNPVFSFVIPQALIATPGTYTLIISAICGGKVCPCTITFTIPECPPEPCDCKNNLVKNPGFWQGAVPGNSIPPAVSNFWQSHTYSPQVANSDYHCDPTCVQLWGTMNFGESIRQMNINFIQGRYYKVSFCAKYIPNGSFVPSVQVELNASNNLLLADPWTGASCTLIGTSGAISNTGGPGLGWQVYTLPVWQAPTNLNHLIINAQTTSGQQAFARIDNVCIEEVAAPCKADFTFTAQGGCGKYQFNNLSAPTAGTTYMWNFGDGSPMVNTTSPMHQYATCGTYTVCLTAKCADGSTSTFCRQLGIIDNVPPVAKCKPGVGVTLNANCQFPVTTAFVDDNSTDNCLIKSLNVSPTVLTGCTNHNLTLTVTDWCNNTSTCTMGIQTTEVVPPVITGCPLSMSVVGSLNPQGICTANMMLGSPTATDNCDPSVTLTNSFNNTNNASGIYPNGPTTVVWTAVDDCGNEATCSFTIIVKCPMGPCIEDFETGGAGQWLGLNGQVSVITDPNTGSQVLKGNDDSGASWMYNNSPAYSGDWTQKFNNCFCFDIRYDNGNPSNPSAGTGAITIYQGSSPLSFTNRATFVVNTPIGNNWTRVCAPVGLASGTTYPSNSYGAWTSTSASDFNSVITGVSGIGFALDFAGGSNPSEMVFVDNFCMEKCPVPCTADISTPVSSGCRKYNFQGFGNGTPTIQYKWDFGDPASGVANNMSTLQNPMHQFVGTGPTFTVTLMVTDGTGCTAMYSVQVTAPPLPTTTITANPGLTICPGQSTTLTTTGGPWTNCLWSNSVSGSSVVVTIPGTYCVTCTDPNGCTATACATVVECQDSCECKPFTGTQFYNSNWPGITQNVSCGQTGVVTLPCLKTGTNPLFFFHGNLNCDAINCISGSVNWAIVQMPGGGAVMSGTTSAWPIHPTSSHFDINLNQSWFTPGTQYMLTVTGMCGDKTCTCKINFRFEQCPCLCDPLSLFWKQVGKGFVSTGSPLSCKRLFKPIALCPNDQVMWTVSGPGFNQTFGPTIGNGIQMITFPGPGIYNICMFVTRTDPNGVVCKREYCRKVYVKCKTMPPGGENPTITACTGGDRLQNGDFTEDLAPGHLGQDGKVANWNFFPNPGDGQVIVDTSGASDDGHIVLIGGKDNFAGIYQHINAHGDSAYIGLSAVNFLNSEGTVLEFRLQAEPFPGSPSQVIYKLALDTSFSAWMEVPIRIPIKLQGDKHFLVVCVQNNNDAQRSVVGIDNLEFCTERDPVSTLQPEDLRHFRIFPNPNPGFFTVELPQPATPGMTFRITDLAGRLMLEKQTETGSAQQTVRAGSLPNGLYFLQVVSEGRVVAVEKLVKQ